MFRIAFESQEYAKEIERTLHAETLTVIENLLRLYLCKDVENRSQWRDCIYNSIHDVDKLEHSKQYPSSNKIFQWTYGKDQDRVTDINFFGRLVKTVAAGHTVNPIPNLRSCMTGFDIICHEYFSWLADELSTCGIVDPKMVDQKLDALGL